MVLGLGIGVLGKGVMDWEFNLSQNEMTAIKDSGFGVWGYGFYPGLSIILDLGFKG